MPEQNSLDAGVQKGGRFMQIEYLVVRVTALISLTAAAGGIIYHELHPLWGWLQSLPMWEWLRSFFVG